MEPPMKVFLTMLLLITISFSYINEKIPQNCISISKEFAQIGDTIPDILVYNDSIDTKNVTSDSTNTWGYRSQGWSFRSQYDSLGREIMRKKTKVKGAFFSRCLMTWKYRENYLTIVDSVYQHNGKPGHGKSMTTVRHFDIQGNITVDTTTGYKGEFVKEYTYKSQREIPYISIQKPISDTNAFHVTTSYKMSINGSKKIVYESYSYNDSLPDSDTGLIIREYLAHDSIISAYSDSTGKLLKRNHYFLDDNGLLIKQVIIINNYNGYYANRYTYNYQENGATDLNEKGLKRITKALEINSRGISVSPLNLGTSNYLTIIDLHGREIARTSVDSKRTSIKFSTLNLSKGVYIAELVVDSRSISSVKFSR